MRKLLHICCQRCVMQTSSQKPLVISVSKGVSATHGECHKRNLLSWRICDGFVTCFEWEDYMLVVMDPCWGNHNNLKTLEKRHKCVHNLILGIKGVVLLISSWKVLVHAFWLVLGKCFYQGQPSSLEAHVKGWWMPWTLFFWRANSIFCVTEAHTNCDYSECLQYICDQNIFSHRRETFCTGRSDGWITRKKRTRSPHLASGQSKLACWREAVTLFHTNWRNCC